MDRRVGDEVLGEGVAGWIVVGGGCGGELGGAVDKSPVITTKNRPSSPTSLFPPPQPGGRNKQTPTPGCFDPLVDIVQQEKSSTMDNQVQHQKQSQQQEIEMTRTTTTPSVFIESSPLASDREVGAEYGEDDVYYTGYQSAEEEEEVDEDLEDLEEEQEDDDDEVVEEEEDQVDAGQDDDEEDDDGLPYPGFVPITLGFMTQYSRPRNFCLRMITNPYPFFQLLFSF